MSKYEITPVYEYFNRECSKNEINRLVDIMNEKGCDVEIRDHTCVRVFQQRMQ